MAHDGSGLTKYLIRVKWYKGSVIPTPITMSPELSTGGVTFRLSRCSDRATAFPIGQEKQIERLPSHNRTNTYRTLANQLQWNIVSRNGPPRVALRFITLIVSEHPDLYLLHAGGMSQSSSRFSGARRSGSA